MSGMTRGRKVVTQVTLEPSQVEQLDALCNAYGASRSWYIRKAVGEMLERLSAEANKP